MDNKRKKLIYETLALASSISSYSGYSIDDMYYLSNENVMNMSLQLLFEIMTLLERGHSYETILKAIEEVDFEQDNFTEDEIEFLKKDAIKSLNIKYKQKNGGNYE